MIKLTTENTRDVTITREFLEKTEPGTVFLPGVDINKAITQERRLNTCTPTRDHVTSTGPDCADAELGAGVWGAYTYWHAQMFLGIIDNVSHWISFTMRNGQVTFQSVDHSVNVRKSFIATIVLLDEGTEHRLHHNER